MPEHAEAETPLQMAQRHVDAGRERIARQEALLAELDRDGQDRMLSEARELLRLLRETQAAGEAHLAREVAKVARRRAD